jgi:flagellar secretion chaperone FliS
MLATAQKRYNYSDTAHQTYKQTQVQSADKSQLVILMFEGAIRFCKTLKLNMEEGEIPDCYFYQTKILQVMTELTHSLNSEDTDLGKTLFKLYEYITISVAKLNVRSIETKKLVEVTGILEQLLETLKQAFGIKIKLNERR